MTRKGQALSVLIVSTLAFTVCFMVWMMFGVIGIPIKKALDLNATQFGLLTATPVLTGSLVRVPLGIWTDRYGGRIVMHGLPVRRKFINMQLRESSRGGLSVWVAVFLRVFITRLSRS